MTDDPRDKRFYQLQKKDLPQHTDEEIREYLAYCDRMIDFVGAKKARREWILLKKRLEAILQS